MMKNALKEYNFAIARCECGNSARQKSVIFNKDAKDIILVKKWVLGFVASLRNRLHDSYRAHSLDITATDSAAITDNDEKKTLTS